jgi:hypothetical protein
MVNLAVFTLQDRTIGDISCCRLLGKMGKVDGMEEGPI